MTEEIRKRENDRAAKRAQVNEKVRPWNVNLATNVSKLKNLADLEWSFEGFYAKVRQFAPSVSREELQEFVKAKGITLKTRPKAKGTVV